jgi:flagellar biosynthesis/type III secretory pathway M-ring protein FliF/YscJ
MSRRKQHLKYQAKKGRVGTDGQVSNEGKTSPDNKVSAEITRTSTKITKNSNADVDITAVKAVKESKRNELKEFTKLPESETKFVRKEIIYIISVVAFLCLLYGVIFLLFKNTGLDEWLSGFIRLNN